MKTLKELREKTLTPAEKENKESLDEKAPQLGKKGMVRAKDGKNYKVQMIQSSSKIEFKVTSEFGDLKTVSVAQLARMFG